MSLRPIPWTTGTTVVRLLEQARGRCYSTFGFYAPAEFEAAFKTFQERVTAASPDGSRISAGNDHLLISARRR